jgi:copper ion binding protein
MESMTLPVSGMTCQGCVASVTRALSRVPGVAKVDVSLPEEKASVEFDPAQTDVAALRAAVERAGFKSPA